MEFRMPRFVVMNLTSYPAALDGDMNTLGPFLTYERVPEAYVRETEDLVVSPYAKHEVETTGRDGFVHIRNCRNNRYWERSRTQLRGNFIITATATEKEEDESKDSCTLFRFEKAMVVKGDQSLWFVHVQSGCYLQKLWSDGQYVVANHPYPQPTDIIFITDWSRLVILPRYLAFKGDNGKYLRLVLTIFIPMPYLQFSTDDIHDPDIVFEVFPGRNRRDGSIYVRQISSDRYWRRLDNGGWIRPDATSDYAIQGSNDAMFRIQKINDNTIALIVGGNYCSRHTERPINILDCLNARLPSLTREAWLTVEEPVVRREILGVNYDLHSARIYDETALFVGEGTSTNSTTMPNALIVSVRVRYEESNVWNTSLSITLGAKFELKIGIPLIKQAKVELGVETTVSLEWNREETREEEFTARQLVVVPARHRTRVRAIATQGKCDVPFTYLQRDLLYNGKEVTYDVGGGTFTGVNYYNIHYDIQNFPIN